MALLLAIAVLAGIVSIIPVPTSMPLPRPHTAEPLADEAALTAAAPEQSTAQAPQASPTPVVFATRPPNATRYVEPEAPEIATAAPSLPPQLLIPDLALTQTVVPVSIVDGVWDLETLEEQVGWLTTTGEQPGGDLAVALVGHVNLALGHPGPFEKLEQLEVHDRIIYRADGLDYVYAVQGQETVEPEAVEALYVPDGTRLLLVTCSTWSYFWRHYAQRLIVTADLVNTVPSP